MRNFFASIKKHILASIPTIFEYGIYLVLGLASYLLLSWGDTFEKMYEFTRAHEEYELDEILLTVPAVLVSLIAMVSYRSWRLTREIKIRRNSEEQALAAKAELDDLLEKKKDFMGIIAHEIRGPVNGVLSIFGILRDEQNIAERNKWFDEAEFTVNNLRHLLNDIFDFARLDRGDRPLQMNWFKIRRLLRVMEQNFLSLAKAKQLELVISIDENIPDDIYGSRLAFHQVLHNLIQNAVKFTEYGGIHVQIRLKQQQDASSLIISVRDTGSGIAKDNLEKIYSPYLQLDSSLRRKHKGLGLGLTMVKRLVEMTNGNIEVSSIVGQGTLFTVELPVSTTEPET